MKPQIKEALEALVIQEKLSPESMIEVQRMMNAITTNWTLEKIEKLQDMIKNWEDSMGDDDKTFYSLGIRRAIDVLLDQTDVLQQLPVLEKEDTPDEQ